MSDWKKICIEEMGLEPPPLRGDILEGVAMMYKTLANELAKKAFSREVFPGSWDLVKTAGEMGRLS